MTNSTPPVRARQACLLQPAGVRGLPRALAVAALFVGLVAAGTGGETASRVRNVVYVVGSMRPPTSVLAVTQTLTVTPALTAIPWTSPPATSYVAVTRPRTIVVHALNSTKRWYLRNPNSAGATLVFLVVKKRAAGGWVVRVPARPNNSMGWVRSRDVFVEPQHWALHLSLQGHFMILYRYGKAYHRFKVGVGRPSAPTPTGHFFLTEQLKNPTTTGAYGPWAYGTSAYSNVYTEFEGGPGQVGMHGTNDPSSIGASVSHGCIRLYNADISLLAKLVHAGTPLTVSP
jgi:hypothetical protein